MRKRLSRTHIPKAALWASAALLLLVGWESSVQAQNQDDGNASLTLDIRF